MASATRLLALRVLMLLICAAWVSLWLLKPTELWTRKWHEAEDSSSSTVFRYNALDFAVYTFPLIALAIIGLVYMEVQPRKPKSRQARSSMKALCDPLIVNSYLGILSATEILAVSLFLVFLAWTFYAHISTDFKKLVPAKSLKLNTWQLKFLKVATRFGLLAEACLALLLLPILRAMAIFRIIGIQFEVSVRYHIWLATAMIFFASLHGSSTFFIWGIKHRIQDEMWKWQKTGRIYLAGEIALVTGFVIWITSLPLIRRKRFYIFYYTHHLYIVFLVFFLFHAGDRHFYMIFPGVFLFGLDKLLRIIQSRPQTCILSAKIYPCNVMELILPKDPRSNYTPTSVIFMKIPSISKLQWHAFSITSSSAVNDQTVSLMIKCEGWWTNSLYNMINSEPDTVSSNMKCIPVAIEGPYGPPSMDFLRYDSLILVAGGIGITPFLSILQEIYSTRNRNISRIPTRVLLTHVMKKSEDMSLLNPIAPLLMNQIAEEGELKLKAFVTQEERPNQTVRGLLDEFLLVKTINFDTECSNNALYGLESFLWMAGITGFSCVIFIIFLCIFNYVFIPVVKKTSKEKNPSWIADLLLLSAFSIAIICSAVVGIILRWRKLLTRKEIPPPFSQKQEKGMERRVALEEHEIHFGGRPNLQDILLKFPSETCGYNIGVYVCGPESMKKSVALACKKTSQGFKISSKEKKPFFTYHSLNFTL